MGVLVHKADRLPRRQDRTSLELTRVLELYPEYYKLYQESRHCLMEGDGSLPLLSRHFIAFLAIRESGCDVLLSQTMRSFLGAGGEKSWITDLNTAPVKLHRLREMTEILWKYPWKLTNHNIKSLTVGKDSWTLSEIVEAVVIISHHQALASFGLGTGQERRRGRQERGEADKPKQENRSHPQLAGRLTEFSWDEQGFSLMSSLYSDMANYIDEKLRKVRSLQPSNQTRQHSDTENICRHVHHLHGIHQDDWTPDGVKDVLTPDERNFLESCLFQRNDADIESLGKKVGYSRKVYLSVIMLEFKHQSQLLFFLQAVMKHLS